MKQKLVIVGIGSLAPEVMYYVKKYDLYDIVGFTVDSQYLIPSYEGYPVYPLENLEEHVDKNEVLLFVAISWYNELMKHKRAKFENLKERGFHFANIISPLASVNTDNIGEGNWIADFASVGFATTIGDNNIIRGYGIVGHHSIIGSHNVLSGRAMVAGDVMVGDQNYFGIDCTIFNKLSIGNKCIVGAAAICKKNLEDLMIVSSRDSVYKKGSEKLNTFIMSTKGQQALSGLM